MAKKKRKSSGRSASQGRPNLVDMHVGNRIRMRRTILGMSQMALAEALGLSFQQVQKYELGANRVSSSRLFDLTRILQVPIKFFFEEMGSEVEAQSPARLHLQGALPEMIDLPGDPTAKRETLELVRAFRRIRDPVVRRRLFELTKALAGLAYRVPDDPGRSGNDAGAA